MHPDNLLQPAYPVSIAVDDKNNSLVDSRDQCAAGFTKLEKASIMIASGMVSDPEWLSALTEVQITYLGETAARIAKSVLEEANK